MNTGKTKMSPDLLEKPDQDADPIQNDVNNRFNEMVKPENYAQDGVRPELRKAEEGAGGSGSLFNPEGDGASKAGGAASAAGAAAVGAAGLEAAEGAAGLYNPVVASARGIKSALFGSRRRKQASIGGSIAGLVIGGSVLLFSFASGPFELIHLGEILAKNFTHTQHSTEIRSRGLFRFARTKDIGQTRVGIWGARSYAGTVSKLNDIGIEFTKGKISGAITDISIDPNKLSKSLPELAGKKPEAQLEIIKSKFPSIADSFKLDGSKIVASTDADIAIVRGFSKSSISLLSDSKVLQAIKFRPFAKVVNAPSIWHPLKKVKIAYENKLAAVIEARNIEEERVKAQQASVNDAAAAIEGELASKFSPVKAALGGVLLVTAAACLARDSADTIETYNHDAIVLKGTTETVGQIAIGSQVKYGGSDVTAVNVSANERSLTDGSGKSVWSSLPLQETAQPGSGTGEDVLPEIAQAYIPSNNAANLKATLGLGGAGAVLCSPLGQLTQLIGGLALIAASIPSGGLSTAGLVALKTGEVLGQAAVTAGVFYAIKQIVVGLAKNHSAVPNILAGPVGGGIMALSAREASNIDARADGGVVLSNIETAAIDQQTEAENASQFQSKTMFARLFDTQDYRSLTSRLMDTPNPNSNTFASMFTNAPSLLFSSLFPKVHAASTPYKWPMPRYDIPTNVLNDDTYANPYDNADAVATMLDAEAAGGDTHFIDRAKQCFGDTVSKGNEGWQVVYDSDINPNSEKYSDANCGDQSSSWKRIMLFVKDSRTMDAAVCIDSNDDSSCKNVGMAGQASSTSPAANVAAPQKVSSSAMSVVLDPGHSPTIDKNSTDATTGLYNYDYVNNPETSDVYNAAIKIKAILESKGIKVTLTKNSPTEKINLTTRANRINASGAELAVTIHSSPNHSGEWLGYPDALSLRTPAINGKQGTRKDGKTGLTHPDIMAPSQEFATSMAPVISSSIGNGSYRARSYNDIYGANGLIGNGRNYGNTPVQIILQSIPSVYSEVDPSELNSQGFVTGMSNAILAALQAKANN